MARAAPGAPQPIRKMSTGSSRILRALAARVARKGVRVSPTPLKMPCHRRHDTFGTNTQGVLGSRGHHSKLSLGGIKSSGHVSVFSAKPLEKQCAVLPGGHEASETLRLYR